MHAFRRASLVVLLATAALLAPAVVAAQSCLGFALNPGQHAIGGQIANATEDGGPGGFYTNVNAANISTQVDLVTYEIWNPVSDEVLYNMTVFTARGGKPVFRSQPWGQHERSGASGGTCAVIDLGGTIMDDFSSYRAGGGLVYALAGPRWGVYAGPLFTMAFSEHANSSGTTLITGVSGRFGLLMANVGIDAPISPSGGKNLVHIRFGYAWGRTVAPPPAPA